MIYNIYDISMIYPSHDICFVDTFSSFIPAIVLNTLRFKSSALFWNASHIYLI